MTAEKALAAAVGQLQVEMAKATFDTWVRDIELVAFEDGTFIIGVQNSFARDWLESRLTSTLMRLLTGMMNRTVEVRFVVWQADSVEADSEEDFEEDAPLFAVMAIGLNGEYTFESFVVGPQGRVPYGVALAVAERPSEEYNPLLIYGPTGSGKSHLLHAIGNHITVANPESSVLYVSAEQFGNELIVAIRQHSTAGFREKFRNVDFLLFDELPFIAGKDATEEEFFHTLEDLLSRNCQVVIASDLTPQSLRVLEERLRSRIIGGSRGLAVEIKIPDLETRIDILESKAISRGLTVPNDVLQLIARVMRSNIRELEGALNRVSADASLRGLTLSKETAEMALVGLIAKVNDLDPENVIAVVASTFGVTPEEILGKGRSREVVLPRQIVMFLLRADGEMEFLKIGQFLGRDHTTIMYGCEKIEELLIQDRSLECSVSDIRTKLGTVLVRDPV